MRSVTPALVSVIIPTYNEERNIRFCLERIRSQRYPQEAVEIIVVDDGSNDQTVSIASSFGARVLMSGYRHIERSKSIGIAAAKGEYLVFIDADVLLVSREWLHESVMLLEQDRSLTGVQTIYWHYRKDHSALNRYCELLGVNDPFVRMLGKRGILGPHEQQWMKPDLIVETTPLAFIAQFTPRNLPTLGSQGYVTRRSLVVNLTTWNPYYFHLDSVAQLVQAGHNRFALLRMEVEHRYVSTFFDFYAKLIRNLVLFLKYQKYREYRYNISMVSGGFWWALLCSLTGIIPLIQSIQGYRKKRDWVWFLHPIFCLTVPVMYTVVVLWWSLRTISIGSRSEAR